MLARYSGGYQWVYILYLLYFNNFIIKNIHVYIFKEYTTECHVRTLLNKK